MVDPIIVTKTAAALLTNEKTRKGIGWVVVAVLSPIILVVALLCSLGSGTANHNVSAAQLCFQDGEIPAGMPAEYRVCIEQMREWFTELDESIAAPQENMEDDNGLDPTRVKAIFYTPYFGGEASDIETFLDCFVSYEERSDPTAEVPETYTVPIPIENMDTVYENIATLLGTEIPEELRSNVESVYSLIKNGYPSTGERPSNYSRHVGHCEAVCAPPADGVASMPQPPLEHGVGAGLPALGPAKNGVASARPRRAEGRDSRAIRRFDFCTR